MRYLIAAALVLLSASAFAGTYGPGADGCVPDCPTYFRLNPPGPTPDPARLDAGVHERMAASLALMRSQNMFIASGDQYRCVVAGRWHADVLETCHMNELGDTVIGAMSWLATAARSAPWIDAHCTPLVGGYRCDWKGNSITVR